MNEGVLFRRSEESLRALVVQLRRLADDLETAGDREYRVEQAAVINDWFIGQRAVPCLLGRFKNHPELSDGKTGCTTELFWIDEQRGIARTLSRWYRLGNSLDRRLVGQALGGKQ
ncbi:hypothetical protein GR217_22875 [Rhizobium leguminosarum]|uniref:Uncharacterized protein n=1 Tax=Rhizobium ruizarguesonis TaxID=2081791 RepID=A0AAE5C430_9HYPH|nr:DUF6634 family protein [Rhizobium ruizarguesonis]NEI50532.1 hypothetical protein [Rhizobium ruizarguesonis]